MDRTCLFISLVILALARHLSSKQIVKENKPRRKVIRLYKAIKGRFKWSEKEYGNDYYDYDYYGYYDYG